MFKCKQCGRQFGANTPKVCPGCGATCNNEDQGLQRLFFFGAIEVLIQLLFLAVFLGLIVGAMGWLFGWF